MKKKEGEATLGAIVCLLVSLGVSKADLEDSWRRADTCHYQGTRLKSPRAPWPCELCQQLVPSANQPVISVWKARVRPASRKSVGFVWVAHRLGAPQLT